MCVPYTRVERHLRADEKCISRPNEEKLVFGHDNTQEIHSADKVERNCMSCDFVGALVGVDQIGWVPEEKTFS